MRNELELIEKIKELFELYDDYGSEMPEVEVNFIKLLLSKATDKGLSIEKLEPNFVAKIYELHEKYSQLSAFDSNEGSGNTTA